jgi:hypothetical protein
VLTSAQTLTAGQQAQARTNIGAASSAATPAFYATVLSCSLPSAGNFNRITGTTEVYDTTGAYASDRFTPQTAGYYEVYMQVSCGTAALRSIPTLYKNGSIYMRTTDSVSDFVVAGACVVYLNGTTDYVDFYCYVQVAVTTSANAPEATFWYAKLL